jgi:ribulose-phosphate 3-epimerase
MCADLLNLGTVVNTLGEKGFDYLHFDVMDGHFVPEIGLGVFFLEQLTKAQLLPVDVHLMVTDPRRYIEPLAEAGASLICIHQEIAGDLRHLLQSIRERGVKSGLAVKPDTRLTAILPFIDLLDLVLLMTYAPGIRNQTAATGFEQRISALSRLLDEHGGAGIDIAVDGGISQKILKSYKEAGANFFIMGSSGLFIPNTRLSDQIDRVKRMLCS